MVRPSRALLSLVLAAISLHCAEKDDAPRPVDIGSEHETIPDADVISAVGADEADVGTEVDVPGSGLSDPVPDIE